MKALHEDQVRMEAVVEALPQAVVWLNKDLVVEEGKEREAALERARLEARRSSENTESRGRFLANMSHELRTPLNAILGYTELLIEEEEEVDGEHLEELRRVHRAGGISWD